MFFRKLRLELQISNFLPNGGMKKQEPKVIVIFVIATSAFYMMSIHILKTILPFIAEQIGATGIQTARVLYIGFLSFALLSPLAGYISNRLGYKKTIFLASIIESLAIFFYIFVRNYLELIVIRIIQAIFRSFTICVIFIHGE